MSAGAAPSAARTRRWPLLLAMLASFGIAGLVAPTLRVRSDLTALLPSGGDEQSRLLGRQLRNGVAASLVLVGLEGAPEPDLARLSRRLQQRLAGEREVRLVENGSSLLTPTVIDRLFAGRYLLAPNTTRQAFETPRLREDFRRLRDALASSASPLVSRYGVPDPTGALPALLAGWRGAGRVSARDGVWFAAGRNRALLLVGLAASGSDPAAQARGLAALRRAVDLAWRDVQAPDRPRRLPPPPRLLLGGAPVFAQAAQAAVEHDVRLLSVASLLLVAGWLSWRFRSPWMLAAIGVTVPASFAVACLAVQLAFGFVHAITLGFGATMLGITVDYPVLLVGHRKVGEPGPQTIRRIGRAFTLSVLTASCGLAGMIGSDFRGIAQLGLFSVAGILTAAALTGWVLPRLIERVGLAPAYAGRPGRLTRLEALRRFRLWGLLPPLLALAALAWLGGVRIDRDIASLTPVPARLLAEDASLRDDLGAPDTGIAAVVSAPDEDAVLARETALLPALDALVAGGAAGSFEVAARLLPDLATQRARQAALPDAATLAARVAAAQAGLGFTPQAFAPFLHDVTAARRGAPIRAADLPSALLRSRLDALLFPEEQPPEARSPEKQIQGEQIQGKRGAPAPRWAGLVVPVDLRDAAAFRRVVAARPDWRMLDVREAAAHLVAGFTSQAWPSLAIGGGLAVLVLLAGTRDLLRTARILAAIAATLLVSVAVLMLRQGRLSLIELVSLQFVAGIGLDYALFFARPQLDDEERARTLRTLLTCNVMALLTFSLLGLCRTPLLRQIGQTVSLGMLLALGFAFLFAGPRLTMPRPVTLPSEPT